MISVGVQYDPSELDALRQRIEGSIRRLGGGSFVRDLEELLRRENEYHAMAGLNRHGRRMNPWRVRKGRSDYHGRDYQGYDTPTVLVPFGRRSRRIDGFEVSVSRRSVLGIGLGGVTVQAGFHARSRLVPAYWRQRDPSRDVLGMPPRTQRAVQLLCTRHASFVHSRLKRGASQVRSAAAAAAATMMT